MPAAEVRPNSSTATRLGSRALEAEAGERRVARCGRGGHEQHVTLDLGAVRQDDRPQRSALGPQRRDGVEDLDVGG